MSNKLLMLAVLIAGCASSQPSASNSSATFGDCKINLRQICEAYVHQPTFTLNGEQWDAERLQKETNPHTQLLMPFSYPNGDLIANLECMIDTQNLKASYARLLPGPPITDKDVQYARSIGLCSDKNGNSPAVQKALQNLTKGEN